MTERKETEGGSSKQPLIRALYASPLGGAESVPKLSYAGSRGYHRSRRRSLDAHLCAQARTLRIRLTDGLNFSIAHSTSPLPPLGSMPNPFS